MGKDLSPKMEIVDVNNDYAVMFIGVGNTYKVSNVKIEGFKLTYLGLLSNFNRIKVLKTWRDNNDDLVQVFRSVLNKRGYDPKLNPTAYLMKKIQ